MHILLTRPLEDSLPMIKRFKDLGHDVSHLPLLKIEKASVNKEYNIKDYNALILTSANALKFLNIEEIDKSKICFAVGHATEKKLLSLGFQNIVTAEGSVDTLMEIIQNNFETSEGKILYLSGETVSFELDNTLKKRGYNIDRIITYRVTHNVSNDLNFLSELKNKIPDMVFIYSENSAKSFLTFIKSSGLDEYWLNTNLMCIGEKASSVLNEIKWKKIFIFNPGEEEYLLYKI